MGMPCPAAHHVTTEGSPKSDPHAYERLLGVAKPKCCSTGDCCKGVSPSKPARELWAMAAAGDAFARNFFSIMQPYASHDEAHAEVPGVVERTLKAAETSPHFNGDVDAVVFYRCRYLQADNRCGVHEDRPQFCRDYPDTPFIVMAPKCAYVPWAKAAKAAYFKLKDDADIARAKLDALHHGQTTALTSIADLLPDDTTIHHLMEANWRLVLSLTPLYLGTPHGSFARSDSLTHWVMLP